MFIFISNLLVPSWWLVFLTIWTVPVVETSFFLALVPPVLEEGFCSLLSYLIRSFNNLFCFYSSLIFFKRDSFSSFLIFSFFALHPFCLLLSGSANTGERAQTKLLEQCIEMKFLQFYNLVILSSVSNDEGDFLWIRAFSFVDGSFLAKL